MDGSEGQMHVADGQPVYSHNVHYMQNHNLSNGNLMDHDEHHDNGGSEGGMEGDVLSDNHSALASHHESDNQLTLSFQGQVYVFDSVSPEKVQAVLLLLGDRGITPNIPTTPLTTHHNDRDLSSTPQRFDVPQRLASLNRFREKRKERNFDKKIRYTVRKEVALSHLAGVAAALLSPGLLNCPDHHRQASAIEAPQLHGPNPIESTTLQGIQRLAVCQLKASRTPITITSFLVQYPDVSPLSSLNHRGTIAPCPQPHGLNHPSRRSAVGCSPPQTSTHTNHHHLLSGAVP
ncbi:hypothetical protein RJ639_034761 [Escallonia herrerae]|uniref:GATA transcription factor 28 n=1 Tax=Escallonia herrerae TaxID=1293975 RepID=A0AA88WWK5_9ASTE|nr:hypothetical protein RJ639_034761 [Escallonia herrerae]